MFLTRVEADQGKEKRKTKQQIVSKRRNENQFLCLWFSKIIFFQEEREKEKEEW